MDYFVLDVETANPSYASICQIGIIEVRGGRVVDERSIFVDPSEIFDPFNVSLHGISEDRVKGAPTFADVYADLSSRLSEQIAVHHGPFDRVAFSRASEKYGLPPITTNWLDNQSIVRSAWPVFARRGYSLKNLCHHFGLAFSHHDALEDARVTEHIFRRALAESGTSPTDWISRARRRIGSDAGGKQRSGDPTGRFHGQTILFTGNIGLPRPEAEKIAKRVGFDIAESISRKVSILVVGMQDLNRLAGFDKSSKQRKAEALLKAGHDIQIVSDADFWAMIPRSMQPALESNPLARPVRQARSLIIDLSIENLFSDDEIKEMFGSVYDEEM